MEFFDLFNLVQMFLPSGTINVSVEIQPQIEALVASYRQSMLICLGVAAGSFSSAAFRGRGKEPLAPDRRRVKNRLLSSR